MGHYSSPDQITNTRGTTDSKLSAGWVASRKIFINPGGAISASGELLL